MDSVESLGFLGTLWFTSDMPIEAGDNSIGGNWHGNS
jgi:hypothetical protein